MIIAMTGLPASGKSAIARPLAERLPALILDKDQIRAALFPPSEIEYSTQQDDFCMDILYRVAGYILQRSPDKFVIVDGRPFARRYQIERLKEAIEKRDVPLRIIECVCSEDSACQRLVQQIERGEHVAANRDVELYRSLKVIWDPIVEPKFVIDTDSHTLEECVELAREYVLGEVE